MGKVFWVSSTVRSVSTRLMRSQAPERARFKQFILGGSIRLVRNRPVCISEMQLEKFSDELKTKFEAGLLEVRESSIEGPIHTFAKKKRRRSTPPPPPPDTNSEEQKSEEKEEDEEVKSESTESSEEGSEEFSEEDDGEESEEGSSDDFVPVEEQPTKRRGRRRKKG